MVDHFLNKIVEHLERGVKGEWCQKPLQTPDDKGLVCDHLTQGDGAARKAHTVYCNAKCRNVLLARGTYACIYISSISTAVLTRRHTPWLLQLLAGVSEASEMSLFDKVYLTG